MFQSWVESVKCVKKRLKFFLENTTIVLHFVWFRCSRVYHWCYVGVPLVFWVFCWCSKWFFVVLPLFRGVPLFHRCSVFCCFMLQCSWLYSMLVQVSLTSWMFSSVWGNTIKEGEMPYVKNKYKASSAAQAR